MADDSLRVSGLLSPTELELLRQLPDLETVLDSSVAGTSWAAKADELESRGRTEVAAILRRIARSVATKPEIAAPKHPAIRDAFYDNGELRDHVADKLIGRIATNPDAVARLSATERAVAIHCLLDGRSWTIGGKDWTRVDEEDLVDRILTAAPAQDLPAIARELVNRGTRNLDRLHGSAATELRDRHVVRAELFAQDKAWHELDSLAVRRFHEADPGNFTGLSVSERVFLLKGLVFDANKVAVIRNDDEVNEAELVRDIFLTTPDADLEQLADGVRPFIGILSRHPQLNAVKADVLLKLKRDISRLRREYDFAIFEGARAPRGPDANRPLAEVSSRLRFEQATERASAYAQALGYAGVGFQAPEAYNETLSPTHVFVIHPDGRRERLTSRPVDPSRFATVEQLMAEVGRLLNDHHYGERARDAEPLPPPMLSRDGGVGLSWRDWQVQDGVATASSAVFARLLDLEPDRAPDSVERILKAKLGALGVPQFRLAGITRDGERISVDPKFAELFLLARSYRDKAAKVDFTYFREPLDQTKLTGYEARKALEHGTDDFDYRGFNYQKLGWDFIQWVEVPGDAPGETRGEVRFVMPYLAYTRFDRVVVDPSGDGHAGDVSATDVQKAVEFRLAAHFNSPADVVVIPGQNGDPTPYLAVPPEQAWSLLTTTVLEWRDGAPGYDPYNAYIGLRIASEIYTENKFVIEDFVRSKGIPPQALRFVEVADYEVGMFATDDTVYISDRGTWGLGDALIDAHANQVGMAHYVVRDPVTGEVTFSEDRPEGPCEGTVKQVLERDLGIRFADLDEPLRLTFEHAAYHKGFLSQVMGGLPDRPDEKGLLSKLAELNPDGRKGVVLLGHSKGGGESTILTQLLDLAGYEVKRQVTMGAARSLNQAAATAFVMRGLGDKSDRLRNGKDIVPAVPLYRNFWAPVLGQVGGYRHVGQELYGDMLDGRLKTGVPMRIKWKSRGDVGASERAGTDHMDGMYLAMAEANLSSFVIPPENLPVVESEGLSNWELASGLWDLIETMF